MAHASQCMCGHRSCKDWHVHPYAAVQGVHFTHEQAKIISAVLNGTAVVVETPTKEAALKMQEHLEKMQFINSTILQKEE